ncbi:MAG TPA: ribonuclease HII [Thermoanaerobaculia bacterium]|nr:ribonuclease HII [Thermoanaerobaculia bacterium]
MIPIRGPSELPFRALLAELARLAEMSAVERELRDFGFRCIAGTDEVGRGSLAGPVVAAAVILNGDCSILGVDDSKQLDHAHRLALCQSILRCAHAVSFGVVEPHTIDRVNILVASKMAMRQAVETLVPRPEVLLIDAMCVDNLVVSQVPLIHGDRRSVSIAAASVVAKVYRDLLMESYHAMYPAYDFASNRGYGTELHWEAIRKHGPSPIHRKSFLGAEESARLFV